MALGGAERGEGGERAFSEVVGVGYGPGHVLGLGELGPARRTRDRASAAAFGLCVGGGLQIKRHSLSGELYPKTCELRLMRLPTTTLRSFSQVTFPSELVLQQLSR